MAIRIDAHQHFWTYRKNAADYEWIDDDMSALRSDFTPVELEPLLSSLSFSGSVAVQARECEAENDDLLALTDTHASVLGIVGWLNLCSNSVEERIAHYAKHPRFRGVRMLLHDYPDPWFSSSEAHMRGVGLLDRYGLTYDLLVRSAQLPSATVLVDELPSSKFVIDHIAKPVLQSGWDHEWASRMTEIARRPNVWCKLSGMVTEADWKDWRASGYQRYLDHVLGIFGPARLMIGSDWPVCLCAADYHATMSVIIEWAEKLSPKERDGILGGNCAEFYGLDLSSCAGGV